MKAVITGAASGIGREIALLLSEKGIETVLVSRREDKLKALSETLPAPSVVEVCDLTHPDLAKGLFEKHTDADIIVNCAGVGVFGEFDTTDLDREIDMINLNITALHILTKLYYREFLKKGEGKILNVASSAAYFVGPSFSSYYASKAYVHRLTRALQIENRSKGVTVTLFSPGPVKTEFGVRDGISDGGGAISAAFAAKRAIDGLFKGRKVVFPNFATFALVALSKVLPESLLAKIVYKQQKKKKNGR